MTSLRHNSEPAQAPLPEPRDVYLDAARACLLDVGWRRTTLTEVARRAGVSRMTIYRTWADMPTLLADLMTREWEGVVDEQVVEGQVVEGQVVDGQVGAVDRLVEGITGTVRSLRRNELFVRIVELDPELILPYLLARRGRSQDHVLALTEAAIRAGQQTGEVRPGDPVAMARALLLASHGFALSLHTMVDEPGPGGAGVTEAALDAELATLVRRALRP